MANVKVAICGRGRAGKDAAGEYLGQRTSLVYGGSLSWLVAPHIARDLGLSLEEAWSRRHTMREYWYRWCNEYRRDDPTRLVRLALEVSDMAVGLRNRDELYCSARQGLFSAILWIERPGVPVDPTLEFGVDTVLELGGIVVRNDGSLTDLHVALDSLVKELKLPERENHARKVSEEGVQGCIGSEEAPGPVE